MGQLSYSKLSTWMSCQQKYYWVYKQGLEPKEVSEGLEFGRQFHKLMEEGNWESIENEISEDVLTVYKDYLFTYSNVPEIAGDVERVERELRLEATLFEGEEGDEPVKVIGYIDKAVFYEDGRVDLWDYKTAAQFPNTDMLAFRPQAHIYWWLLKQNYPECIPNNFVWDFIRNKPANLPKTLKSGGLSSDVRGVIPASVARAGLLLDDSYTEDKIEEIRRNESIYFKRVECPFDETVHSNVMSSFARAAAQLGIIDDLNTKNQSVYNIGRDCDWCEYAPLCRLSLSGADLEEYIERAFTKREEGKNV